MAKKVENIVGRLAFLVGFILAIILGSFGILDSNWTIVLVVIGLLVGLLNITGKESYSFLISGVVLVIASTFGMGVMQTIEIGGKPVLANILYALLVIFVPATIIVAVRNVFSLAKD